MNVKIKDMDSFDLVKYLLKAYHVLRQTHICLRIHTHVHEARIYRGFLH